MPFTEWKHKERNRHRCREGVFVNAIRQSFFRAYLVTILKAFVKISSTNLTNQKTGFWIWFCDWSASHKSVEEIFIMIGHVTSLISCKGSRPASFVVWRIARVAKGQLISKCPFGVIVWTKITTKKFDKFLP